jgi:hypothetical protein
MRANALLAVVIAFMDLGTALLPSTAAEYDGRNAVAEGINGSWALNCDTERSIIIRGVVLLAQCDNGERATSESELDLTSCASPLLVGSQAGVVFCESGPRPTLFPWEGAWSRSCIDHSGQVVDRRLIFAAKCTDASGHFVSTSIDVESCADPIAFGNVNGQLVCESGLRPAEPQEAQLPPQVPPQAEEISNQDAVSPSSAGMPTVAPDGSSQAQAMSPELGSSGPYVAAVSTLELNIRSSPKGGKLGTLAPGEAVQVACSRGWCQLADGRGFVAENYLDFTAPVAAQQAVPTVDGNSAPAATMLAEGTVPVAAAMPTEGGSSAPPQPAAVQEPVFEGTWSVALDGGRTMTLILLGDASSVRGIGQLLDDGVTRTVTLTGLVDLKDVLFTYTDQEPGGGATTLGTGSLTLFADGSAIAVSMRGADAEQAVIGAGRRLD